MKDKKQRLTILIISILVLVIGMSYAYYSAVVQGTGNANAEASGKTTTIGEVEFNGTKTFVTTLIDEIYPGFIGIQEFTISPYKDGTGIYEVDLQAGVPEAFGDDIRISVYKTSDKANNNVARTEGELTINNNQYTKQDILTINGVPEKVYEGTLKTTNLEVVEQLKFTIENTAFTTPSVTPDGYYTYYAVYEYLDNGDQNNQQGLDFEGKFTVRYVTDNEYNAASYITSLVADASKGSINEIDNGTDASGCTNTLAYDDYGNLRYVGTNPCNYITFNGEAPEAVGAKYEIYINGTIQGVDTLEACEEERSMLGIDGTCSLNSDTGKYDLTLDGYFQSAGQFDTISDCESNKFYKSFSASENYNSSCRLHDSGIYSNGWRIIGVVDGKLKIIRNNKIGDYSWDSSEQSVNSGKGINQWGESGSYKGADLMKLLNPGYEDNTDSTYSCVYNETTKQDDCELVNNSILINNSLYWNKTSGKCYNNNYNQSVDCDFSETGLTSAAKNMIDNHHWYLGAINSQGLNNANAKTTFYENERKNQTGKICTSGDGCNDNVIRTTKWNGYVGLAYGSDIIYSNGGVNRITCIENSSAINSESPGCNNTWLKGDIFTMPGENMNFYSNGLISPTYSSNSATGALNTLGAIGAAFMESMPTSSGTPILPTVYLKSNVKITGGDGTPTNPFIVSQ